MCNLINPYIIEREGIMISKIKKSKTIYSFIGIALIALVFAFSFSQNVNAAEKQIVLKLGHESIPDSQWGMIADWFAERVAYKTNGKLKVEVYPSSQLGGAAELIEGCKMGMVDIIWSYPGMISRFVPEFSVLDANFLFRDIQSMYKFANGPIAEELGAKAEDLGIIIAEYSFMGTRHMTANIEVKSPKDLKGVKIRSIPTPISLQNAKSFGATPTPVAWEELYGAMESGLVAGQENPVAEIIDMKFYQVQKYLMLTGHQRMFTVHAISKKKWDKLPEDIQNVISETMAEMVFYNEGLVKEKTRKGLQFLGTKLKIVDAESGLDLDAFRQKALSEIPPKFEKDWGDLYQRISKSLYN